MMFSLFNIYIYICGVLAIYRYILIANYIQLGNLLPSCIQWGNLQANDIQHGINFQLYGGWRQLQNGQPSAYVEDCRPLGHKQQALKERISAYTHLL